MKLAASEISYMVLLGLLRFFPLSKNKLKVFPYLKSPLNFGFEPLMHTPICQKEEEKESKKKNKNKTKLICAMNL